MENFQGQHEPEIAPLDLENRAAATAPAVDDVVDFFEHIKDLGEKETLELLEELQQHVAILDFRLGGVLSRINREGWFAPHTSLREFVEKEHKFGYRKARYLIGIFEGLVRAQIHEQDVSDIEWCKLREIARVLTPENCDHWLGRARELSRLQLSEEVRKYKKGQPVANVSILKFKPDAEQKKHILAALEKAKEKLGAKDNADALTKIGKRFIDRAGLVDDFKALGVDGAKKALTEAFPNQFVFTSTADAALE